MTLACPHHPEVVDGLTECSRCGLRFCPDCLIQLQGRPVCASCKLQGVLDIQSNSQAGTDTLVLASRWSRLGGRLIDNIICSLAISPWWLPRLVNRPHGTHAAFGLTRHESYLLLGAILLYDFALITACGQTLGKMAMGTQVVQVSGETVRTRHALLRAGSRVAFEGLRFLSHALRSLGLILPLTIFLKQRRCLHDFCAGTIVVKKPNHAPIFQESPP